MFPRGPEDWGGIFVQEQVKALRNAGIDARVIVGDLELLGRRTWRHLSFGEHIRPVRTITWRDVGGVPTLYFGYVASYPPWWGRLAAISYRREVKRWAPRIYAGFPFALVHAHTAFLDGGAGAWLARRFRVPMVLTEHTGPFSALTEQPMMHRQTERAINSADVVIAVSETLKRDILARVRVRNGVSIRIVANGVDLDVFRPNEMTPSQDGTVRALWIGGFLPVKQPLMLIEAFHAAWRQDPRLRLSMVGSGPLELEILRQIRCRGIEDAVSVLPSATRSRVADYIRSHHFLVISSESETFGLVAVEALACGRPVLSTRCGGPEETIRGTDFGELVGNSAKELAKGFVTMASRLGEFAPPTLHAFARYNYGLGVIADHLQRIYAEVLQAKKEGRH